MCMLKARVRLPRRDKKGQGCKQEGVSSKRAMFSRLGGLSSLSGFLSLSLSLSPSLEPCIKAASSLYLAWAAFLWYGICLFYASYTLLDHTFRMSMTSALLFPLCVLALCMMCVCVYIYVLVCGDHALCMMDSHG